MSYVLKMILTMGAQRQDRDLVPEKLGSRHSILSGLSEGKGHFVLDSGDSINLPALSETLLGYLNQRRYESCQRILSLLRDCSRSFNRDSSLRDDGAMGIVIGKGKHVALQHVD